MKLQQIIGGLIIFISGLLVSFVFSESFNIQAGSNTNFPSGNSISSFFTSGADERISPYDWIKQENIHVLDNKVIIDIDNPEWAGFTDTNSMDPIIDIGSNAIQIIPTSKEMIHVGDIISYSSPYTDATIIHRVIKIDNDDKGWYAITKGDNLKDPDPEKIRFSQINRILVAIVY